MARDIGLPVAYRPCMPRDTDDQPTPLPSRPSGGTIVAGMLATLDRLILNRARTTTQIEVAYDDPWASANGMTVDGLDEPMDRPEPPDRSGARL